MPIDTQDRPADIAGIISNNGERAYLRTPAAAEYLGLAQTTLEKMRHRGEGPKFRRLGSKVVTYAVSDLDAWTLQGAMPAEQAA